MYEPTYYIKKCIWLIRNWEEAQLYKHLSWGQSATVQQVAQPFPPCACAINPTLDNHEAVETWIELQKLDNDDA